MDDRIKALEERVKALEERLTALEERPAGLPTITIKPGEYFSFEHFNRISRDPRNRS
jgi:hypothetical protein